MRKIVKYLKIMLLVMFIYMIEITNVNAATNPYAATGPYGTNCTWYAWNMAYEKAGVALPGFGNAKEWYNDAKNAGYSVGTTPRANSIIVWGGWTSYGHVGYVERVEGNTLYVWDSTGPCIDRDDPELIECIANGVSEETDKICYANAKRGACEYTISPDLYGITGYIYLDEAPKTPSSSSSSNQTTTIPEKEESVPVVEPKSNNANLASIELSSGEVLFDPEILEYDIEVGNEVDVITISAIVEDGTATVDGMGDYSLNVGLNEIKLIVTAEDGSTKEYLLRITRDEPQEQVLPEEVEPEVEEVKKADSQDRYLWMTIMGIEIVVLLLSSIILFFLFKKRKQKNIEKEK